jgi:ParB-like chromosome segregation protein Spo0J
MRDGEQFPPIEVYHDGEQYWIADGWHRFWAANAAGLEEIEAIVHQGGELQALEAGCGANASHGLRRTNADKRYAVEICFERLGYEGKADRVIADLCAVSHTTVARVRKERKGRKSASTGTMCQLNEEAGGDSEPEEEAPKRVGKDGKARKAPEKKAPDASIEDELFGDEEEESEDDRETIEELAAPTLELEKEVRGIIATLKKIGEWQPYIESARSSYRRTLDELAGSIKNNTAAAPCPQCDSNGCDSCRQTGYITHHILRALQERGR